MLCCIVRITERDFHFQSFISNLKACIFFMRLHLASTMPVNRSCVLPLKKSAVKI